MLTWRLLGPAAALLNGSELGAARAPTPMPASSRAWDCREEDSAMPPGFPHAMNDETTITRVALQRMMRIGGLPPGRKLTPTRSRRSPRRGPISAALRNPPAGKITGSTGPAHRSRRLFGTTVPIGGSYSQCYAWEMKSVAESRETEVASVTGGRSPNTPNPASTRAQGRRRASWKPHTDEGMAKRDGDDISTHARMKTSSPVGRTLAGLFRYWDSMQLTQVPAPAVL